MADKSDTLTQEDIDFLHSQYGGGLKVEDMGLKVGMPISMLAPAYMGMTPGETEGGLISGSDPVRDRLVASGWLQSGADAQGNQQWAPGASWQAQNPRTGTNDVGGASFVNFGVSPGGNIFNSNANVPGAMKSWWDTAPVYGTPDPLTGIAKVMQPGKLGADFGSWWDRLDPGPLIGAAIGAGMGGLGMFGDLGGLGRTIFNTAGQEVLGNKPNPLSAVGPLLNQAGGGPMSQLMSIMRNW